MFRPHPISAEPRRGIVLLVVLSMLTLFAIMGLSFVLVAQAQGDAAMYASQGESLSRPDVNSEVLLSQFLSAIIYGTDLTRSPRSLLSNPNCTIAGSIMLPGGTSPGPGSDATVPDSNNFYLAAFKADGTPIAYSYVRSGSTLNLRANVPTPEFTAGQMDVQNLIGRTSANDSNFTDIGYPILTTRDGTRYVPMFATCIVDLNNRIDLNAHGNIRAGNQAHASNQGWVPSEVSLALALTLPPTSSVTAPATEWLNIFKGSSSGPASTVNGRYGAGGSATTTNPTVANATFAPLPHKNSGVDFDGTTSTGSVTTHFSMPTTTNIFPAFPNGYDGGSPAELANHPLLNDLSQPRFSLATNEALYRYGDTGAQNLICDPFRLCPNLFRDPQVRWMVSAGGGYESDRPGLQRVDLNQTLTEYTVNPSQAIIDRQNMAKNIFNNLKLATGVTDTPTQRQLAQLAVNIVDFIDDDDYMTPFNWKGDGSEWLFGTEQPKVVLNEAYAEYTVSGSSAAVKVWAELLNPLSTDPTWPNNGTVTLDGAYQLLITAPNTNLRSPTNLVGSPDSTANQVYGTVSAFSSQSIAASNGAASGQGYCLLGPAAVTGSSTAPTVTSPQMAYTATTPTPPAPTLLLQRLACPALPAQTNPSLANYNPYVTVDYMENVTLNNTTTAVTSRASVGRPHPYGGLSTLLAAQTSTPANQPKNSFLQPNNNFAVPANWLVHLDRQLVSPMELLNVSCYKPHELTQQFMTVNSTGSPVPFNHLAPWFGQNTSIPNQPNIPNLYRAFEYLETHNRATGTPQPSTNAQTLGQTIGRMPGMININTVWDLQVFRALCDAQASNGFTQAQVDAIFTQINNQRLLSSSGQYNPSFKPFKGLRDQLAQNPTNGIADTFMRANDGSTTVTIPRYFEVPGKTNPYEKYELMTKIYNNLTSRSHVFAVWVTVGFFQVNDDGSFGAELGRSENRQVRHRMFAIVNRSVLTSNPGPQLHFDPRATTSPGATTGRVVPYWKVID